MSVLVNSVFYLGYFVIVILVSWVIKKMLYKLVIVIGLSLFMIGCLFFFLVFYLVIYGVFLIVLFVIVCGFSFLEMSVNMFSMLMGFKLVLIV